MTTKFDSIDVDKRIDELFEMAQRVMRDNSMTRAERAQELQRIGSRCVWWDARREDVKNLDVLADALAAPGASEPEVQPCRSTELARLHWGRPKDGDAA